MFGDPRVPRSRTGPTIRKPNRGGKFPEFDRARLRQAKAGPCLFGVGEAKLKV
jgi:hypothetical protein